MKNSLFALLLLLSAGNCLPGRAAGDDGRTFYVYGQVFNPVTRERLKDVFAELLTTDSVVVDTMRTDEHSSFNNKRGPWNFNLAKYGDRPYIVRFTKDGYRPAYINIPAPKLDKMRPDEWKMKEMSPVFMRRAPRDYRLGEASVTATRVVFCQRGDTLVYNADALALPEGSTLDALIRQLPGVELKEGGQIYVNGRYVEQLLLGGKDFFDSDRQLMLDNLPSFMVKNVEVYEKESELNRYIGRNVEEKKLVMDVKLKKQYHIGTIANAEAGGGTEGRYMGRLFAMRFTPRSQLMLVGNINNLNDKRKPGQNTTWTPDKMPTGTYVTKMGGLDYQFEDELTGWKVKSEFLGRHTTSDNYSEQSSEEFLSGGNTFGRSFTKNHSGQTQLSLHNSFSYTGKLLASGNLWGNLSRNRNRGSNASATFSDNPDNYIDGHVLDSLQGPASGDLLRRLALNRTLQASRGNSDAAAGGVFLQTYVKFLDVSAAFNFNVSDAERFRHYRLDYPVSGQVSDYQNRYSRNHPEYSMGYRFRTSYIIFLKKGFSIIPSYSVNGRHSNQNYALHRLERLDGWGEGTDHAPGTLPSEAEWVKEQTYDDRLSYTTRLDPVLHKVNLHLQYEHVDEKRNQWHVEMSWPLNVNIQRVYHKRYTYEGHNRIKNVYVNPSFRVQRQWHEFQRMWEFKYDMNTQVPDFISQLLDYPNDDDPLNVGTGNPDLKSAVKHEWKFSIQLNDTKRQLTFGAWTMFNTTANAIARGFTYDHATGARFYRPENVNGNYLWQTSLNFSRPIDRKKRLTLASYTFIQLQHGVDLITVTGGIADGTPFVSRPSRSTVNTTWTTETLNLTYRKGMFSVGANGYAGYNHSSSRREGFVPQRVWQYNYGLTGQVELPGKIQVSTDLKVYGHRGFSDPAGNTDDLVWNARVSRHFAKANLTVMLDGFDLLRQLSNRTFFMNSQGRFETYNNALPAYFMGHVIFRFNKEPKK